MAGVGDASVTIGGMNMARRLYRSRTDRVLGGVSGGLGDYFGIDSTIIRLVFVLLTLWGGAGGVLYIIAWLIVPRYPGGGYEAASAEQYERQQPRRIRNNEDDRRVIGWAMVIIGLSVLVLNIPILGLLFSPAVLIGGALIIWGLFTVGKNGGPRQMR